MGAERITRMTAGGYEHGAAATVRTASAVAVIVLSGCFSVGDDEVTGPTEPRDDKAPEWKPGQWWRYDGSDGNTYTYRVEGSETKEGFDTYRVSVQLRQPDGFGVARYDYWYDIARLGQVAAQRGEVYGKFDCAYAAWFPLENTDAQPCTITMYRYGGFLSQRNASWSKSLVAVEDVEVSAGKFLAHKLVFNDVARGGTLGTAWYSAAVEGLVKEEGSDGITYRLEAWGK